MTDHPDEKAGRQDSFNLDECQELERFTLADARMDAIATAFHDPGDYGRFTGAPIALQVIDAIETEDQYEVTLSLRPHDIFVGTPGQEQFFFAKDGRLTHRQVLSIPEEDLVAEEDQIGSLQALGQSEKQRSWIRSRVGLLSIGVLLIVVAGVVVAVIALAVF